MHVFGHNEALSRGAMAKKLVRIKSVQNKLWFIDCQNYQPNVKQARKAAVFRDKVDGSLLSSSTINDWVKRDSVNKLYWNIRPMAQNRKRDVVTFLFRSTLWPRMCVEITRDSVKNCLFSVTVT